jgi:hypothetical protein
MYALYYGTSKKSGCALYYGMEGVMKKIMEEKVWQRKEKKVERKKKGKMDTMVRRVVGVNIG